MPEKKSKLSLYISIIAVGCLLVLLGAGLTLNPRDVPSPLINKPAPEFSIPNLLDNNNKFSKKDLLNQVTLVNVWATWCPSCRAEHEVLLAIAKTKLVKVYGIDWKDEPKKAKQWLQSLGNPYEKTGDDQNGDIGIDFGVYGAPETYLIDKKGIIRYKHTGPVSWQDWQNIILPKVNKIRRQP